MSAMQWDSMSKWQLLKLSTRWCQWLTRWCKFASFEPMPRCRTNQNLNHRCLTRKILNQRCRTSQKLDQRCRTRQNLNQKRRTIGARNNGFEMTVRRKDESSTGFASLSASLESSPTFLPSASWEDLLKENFQPVFILSSKRECLINH